jgi:hypothetical protein
MKIHHQWAIVAVNHYNTGHPHVHVIVQGRFDMESSLRVIRIGDGRRRIVEISAFAMSHS